MQPSETLLDMTHACCLHKMTMPKAHHIQHNNNANMKEEAEIAQVVTDQGIGDGGGGVGMQEQEQKLLDHKFYLAKLCLSSL